MTIREHEDYDIDDEIQPASSCCATAKFLIDAVSDCSSWAITVGAACLIVLTIVLMDEDTSYETIGYAELGLLSFGLFGCATGTACKVAACCVEDEPGAHMVEMV